MKLSIYQFINKINQSINQTINQKIQKPEENMTILATASARKQKATPAKEKNKEGRRLQRTLMEAATTRAGIPVNNNNRKLTCRFPAKVP